jgi:hypothetical protein
LSAGLAVSLKISPIVSPTIEALCKLWTFPL